MSHLFAAKNPLLGSAHLVLNSIGAVLVVVNALTMDDVIHKDASRRDVIVIIVQKVRLRSIECFVL